MKIASGVLAGILSTLAVVVVAGRGGSPKIEESSDSLAISLAGYNAHIPYVAIDSVTLRHGLDGIEGRRNALQSGNTYAGRFAMRPYGEADVFVDALKEPLVVIHAAGRVTILSAPDSLEAEALTARLRAVAAPRGQTP